MFGVMVLNHNCDTEGVALHCPLTYKQHRNLSTYQQHQEYPTIFPPKYCPGPILLKFKVQIAIGLSNMARLLARLLAWLLAQLPSP